MRLRKALEGKLKPAELKLVPTAFEIIGDIAVIEIPDEILGKKKDIAKALLKVHKRLKTVCVKSGDREGDFRTRRLEVVLGRDTVTEHREHGCVFRMDVRKVYFSPRESTERQRVSDQVKPGENVLVMFSGISPMPIVIARRQPRVGKIYAIDINPDAFEYAVENVRVNRVQEKVVPLVGDVREACPMLGLKFDRIAMPLPKEAKEFLGLAISLLKPGGVIHFYHWDHEEHLFDAAVEAAKKECGSAGRSCRILDKRKVLPYGPRVWKICVDFRSS